MEYFTNLKADMEEKRKNLMTTGSGWGAPREDGARVDGGGGAREDGGGGGGGGRKSPFVYYTRAVPTHDSFTAFEHGVNF